MKCIYCGCTDDRACEDGCFWVTRNPPTCSACVPAYAPGPFRDDEEEESGDPWDMDDAPATPPGDNGDQWGDDNA